MKIKYLITSITILLYTGCSDEFLDKQPYGASSSELFFQTEQDAILGINAVYDEMQGYKTAAYETKANGYDCPGLMWGQSVREHSDLTNLFGKIRIFTITPVDGGVVGALWNRSYIGIQRVNQVIENVPAIENMDQALQERILGEAYFLRAYFYHYLYLWFGGVPIIDRPLDPTDEASYVIPRASKEEMLNFIADDLVEAEKRLPESYTGEDVGRATAGAAKTLLTKVLLWQKDYSSALTKIKEVEGMGYALVDDYASLFDGTNENSSESVFEFQFEAIVGQDEGSILSLFYGPNGEGFVPTGGWGWVRPLPDMVEEYEDGDSRLTASVFQIGDTFTKADGTVKVFQDLVGGTGYAVRKYVVDPPTGATVRLNYGPQNFHEIRYAEVILLHAEALLRNDQKDLAIAEINRIRARPSVNLPLLDASAMSMDDAWDALVHEFRVEFAFEAKFGYALRRWGIVDQFHAEKGLTDYDPDKHKVLPIPQDQIDFSKGTLEQNPGY
ncbi:MAG: RagB/SusD family nutrient uptake outer membrane protein [Cytophagales bacterium]|nr:RagB/SusD family nutrient uptake outer membrane protein [Cytophagales bacterium]